MGIPQAKEIDLPYEPQPKQLLFHESKADEVFYGGAAGGGKTKAIFEDMVNACLTIPDYTCAIFRRTFTQLEKTHIREAKKLPPSFGTYNAAAHEFRFVNGSLIEFNYCQALDDVYNYQSSAWDALYIDELTHFAEFQYLYLMSRVRTIKSGISTKVKTASNPGNIGHTSVKKRFIEPVKPFKTWSPEQSFEEKELGIPPRTRCFIPATLDDNQVLDKADPSYRLILMSQDDTTKAQLLYGDWDAFQGQFFDRWRPHIHIVDLSEIPDWWFRFGSYDHGFAHNCSFGWYAVDGDGNIFKYREFVKNRLPMLEIAEHINSFKDTALQSYKVAGRDLWLPGRDGGPALNETFAEKGLLFSPASIDRITGAHQVRKALDWTDGEDEKGKVKRYGPRFFVTRNCRRTIECLPSMLHDDNNQEDVKKVDSNEAGEGGDDAYDETRYGLMSRPITKDEPEDLSRLQQHIRAKKEAEKGEEIASGYYQDY